MFNQPYSIYIDKRPMRIAFLVDSASASLESVDQIIDYNRGLWGGRFNPIILTDGRTIEDKWWKFLRDVDPDVIKSLVSLDSELIERFENFLSPLAIEQPREDERSSLRARVSVYDTPAGIDINSLNFLDLSPLHLGQTLGIFDLEEMDDDIGRCFVLRNFGTYEPRKTVYPPVTMSKLLESALSQGVVPSEIHVEFQKGGVPLSRGAFSKQSVKRQGSWAIIDRKNKQIYDVNPWNDSLYIQPETRSFEGELRAIEKKVHLVTDRKSLADALLKLSHTHGIVFRDQACALPNTERESEEDEWAAFFDVIVGDTLQDIVYFWNRPLLVKRWKRGFINHMWFPTDLAKDTDMEDALCAWIARVESLGGKTPRTVRFISFSLEKRELGDIASRFRENLHARNLNVYTATNCLEEPQIPNFRPENPFFSIRKGMDIHRAQGNEGILELTDPKEVAIYPKGHWMTDFHIEFTHDKYGNNEDVIRRGKGSSLFWKFPNRNHLAHHIFDKPSRVKRNGFPSVMMQKGGKVLRFTLEGAESVVASLFWSSNYPAHEHDPRTQFATSPPYNSVEISDKGKYLQGTLELFGNLTLANHVLSNPYWRAIFDALSKNTHAEQHAHEAIANKLRKQIRRSGTLTVENQSAIESFTAHIINEAKKLDFTQKAFPFRKFTQEAKRWQQKYAEHMGPVEEDLIGFRSEDVKGALQQLTRRNIIQIGIRPHCPRCGLAQWYHVDDIGQHLTCQGCRIQFPIHPELTWHYRLNELIQAAHAMHGTTPVIMILGQLLKESKTSFLFSPNLNLLAKPQGASPEKLDKAAEVDIACIQDGKFIIGEVKQSASLFKEKDFDAIANIAERTKPDIVLFSCLDSQQPTKSIDKHIERIRVKLSPLEIDVKWHELEYLDYTVTV